jgi:glutaredoxin
MKKIGIIYTRQDCHLCHELYAEIATMYADSVDLNTKDIDEDIELKKRYGLTIPVLTIDNIEIQTRPLDHNHIRKILKS